MRQAWNSSSAELAEAFRLGKAEADAATNLISCVPRPIVERLAGYVRTALYLWQSGAVAVVSKSVGHCQDLLYEQICYPRGCGHRLV